MRLGKGTIFYSFRETGDTMANVHDLPRNQFILTGSFRKKGYDW